MTTTTTSRNLAHPWTTAYATAPPPSCSTLRNLANTIAWGALCVFSEDEDTLPGPFSLSTACLPWITSSIYPSPSAFYSPATACPSSWTPVATQTSGDAQWMDGETQISCCPDGMQSDGGSGCRVDGGSGNWSVLECGEADAEENELRTYAAELWPASVTQSVDALRLRYRDGDIGRTTASSGTSSSTASGEAGGGSGSGGLSTRAIAAVATVIPLLLIIGAFAAFMLWRRRRNKKMASAGGIQMLSGEKSASHTPSSFDSTQQVYQPLNESKQAHLGTAAGGLRGTHGHMHETPEWNAELDAGDAERQHLVSVPPAPVSSAARRIEASELGGLARVPRKPVAPVEIDSIPVVHEVGDAYIPYRPSYR